MRVRSLQCILLVLPILLLPATASAMDAAGNLYGVTSGRSTFGSVLKLSPGAGGKWKFTMLYDFKNGVDGSSPSGSLFMDASGN